MGKVGILISGNRVLKTMCFQIEMSGPTDFLVSWTSDFYLKTHGLLNAFFGLRQSE